MIVDKLINKIAELKNPTVVGLDPNISFIPKHILSSNYEKYGQTLEAIANAFYDFNVAIIDEISDLIPAVKPQIAMYEKYGFMGVMAYEKTCKYAMQKGLIVIGDIKRGDIGSTAEAYSDGHIGKVEVGNASFEPFDTHMVTINPYLGYDSVEPFVKNCIAYSKGVFVLVKTSNPNSAEIQDLELADGQLVYEKVAVLVDKWGANYIGESGFNMIGAVVGATYPKQAEKLRKLMPNTLFLVPGYGAQGGTADDIKPCFDTNGRGAIVNSSRGIIGAFKLDKYKNDFAEKDFAKASKQAVIDMQKDLSRVLY